jgi:hypothetical protein
MQTLVSPAFATYKKLEKNALCYIVNGTQFANKLPMVSGRLRPLKDHKLDALCYINQKSSSTNHHLPHSHQRPDLLPKADGTFQ